MLKRLEETRLLAMCMCSDNREAFSRLVELHQQGAPEVYNESLRGRYDAHR